MASLIDGKFLMIRNIGEGAAGQVVEAAVVKDCDYAHVGERVAIKQYKKWVFEKPGQYSRILSELTTGGRINSTNIVKTHELVENDDGLCLVMELITGNTLTQFLLKNPELDFPVILQIINGLSNGLKKIHDTGIIHRDIKPDNIMVTETDSSVCPVIMDLGVVQSPDHTTATSLSEFLGTIRYAAPEYLFGEKYDQKIDVYSLGCVFYEMVTGEPSINPALFWSKQVLEKDRWQFTDHKFNHQMYKRLGFRKSRFFASLLYGMLSHDNEMRFNIEKVRRGIEERCWEKSFPCDLYGPPYSNWPELPTKLREECEVFYKKYPDVNEEVLHAIYDTICGLTRTLYADKYNKNEVALYDKLKGMGLLESGYDYNDDFEEWQGRLSPLSWQVLLDYSHKIAI